MRLLLLDAQTEEIDAVVISWGTIVDESNRVVCGANSKAHAEEILRRLNTRYPEHQFYLAKEDLCKNKS